jgi:hypothetical protein
MPKDKIDAKAIRQGPKGVKFKIDAKADGFGKMQCEIMYHLDSEEMAAAILQKAEEAEGMLDGMEVDITDDASIGAYVGACGQALTGIMQAVKTHLS